MGHSQPRPCSNPSAGIPTNRAENTTVSRVVELARSTSHLLFLLHSRTERKKKKHYNPLPTQHDTVPQHLHCVGCIGYQLAVWGGRKRMHQQLLGARGLGQLRYQCDHSLALSLLLLPSQDSLLLPNKNCKNLFTDSAIYKIQTSLTTEATYSRCKHGASKPYSIPLHVMCDNSHIYWLWLK